MDHDMTNDPWQARVHRESNVDINLDCVARNAMSAPTSDTWEELSVVRCYYCSCTGKQGITCKGRGEHKRPRPVIEPRSAAREGHRMCWACLGARQCRRLPMRNQMARHAERVISPEFATSATAMVIYPRTIQRGHQPRMLAIGIRPEDSLPGELRE